MIVRGTTPYHSFIIPLAPEQIQNIYISYSQNGKLILNKEKADIEIMPIVTEETEVEETEAEETEVEPEGEPEEEPEEEIKSSLVGLHLSQEDTLGFKFYPAAEKNIAVIQLRILDMDNEAYASEPITERISGVIKDGIMGGE